MNSGENAHLGIAGKTAQYFIHSPLTPMLYIGMLAMGLMGLIFTPRQEDPQISVPMIDLFVSYPGARSEQVAAQAIEPLERAMSEIPGVKHVYSASQREQGMVIVRFKVGEDLGESIVKVHEKVQSRMDELPPNLPPPLVKPKSIDDVPVVTLTLWSESIDGGTLRKLAVNLLQELKQIPSTGKGFVVGGRRSQINIEVLPERLSGFGISLDQVAQTIQTANAEAGTGVVETAGASFKVYTGAFLRSAEDVANLVVGVQGGQPIYLRNIARVSSALNEPDEYVSYYTGPAYAEVYDRDLTADGEQAVTIAVAKKIGTNGVVVANDIIDKIETLKDRMIPPEVNVEVTRNYGETANDKVNELLFKLVVATGAVTILVLFSLGWRPSVVVTLVIPNVILMTVFAAWVWGMTIDRVSLFALIFSIGILVDDAIVVIENIYRRWLMKGEMDTETAVDAVREVGNPTILATFTVIAALMPMAFVSGLMGPYMAPIPKLGSVAMLISLFAAFVFTPWFATYIKPTLQQLKVAEDKEHKTRERIDKVFRSVLPPLIHKRLLGWSLLIGLFVAFFAVCAMFYTTAVTVKMLPFDNKAEFSVVVDMPEGTAVATTENLNRELAETLRDIPEVTAVQTYAGTAKPFDFNGMVRHYYLRDEPWHGELQVQLKHKSERKRSSHEIAVEAREKLTPIAREAGARITIAEMPPGPPVLQSVAAEIYGPERKTRVAVAEEMTRIFESVESLADVDNYMAAPHEVWHFEIDTQKAVRRGISVDAIIRNLSMAMGGFKVDRMKVGSSIEPTYIVIEIPLSARTQMSRLAELPIASPTGTTVPLGELGRFERILQDPIIYHQDLRPVEYVVGDAVGRLGAPIYPMLEVDRLLKNYTTPDGQVMSGYMIGPPPADGRSGFEWGGEWTVTYETFRDMGISFAVALVLIYMLVVGMFGNFSVPAVIMAPIPLTLLGIIPGHWIMNAQFTATSMIGFIALAGIIVRNSILLVDFTIAEVKRGISLEEAVIRSCEARTRPILITAFALVGGSSVILTDPIFQGMAVSLLFGVLVSTLLTLVVIPLGCVSIGIARVCPSMADSEDQGEAAHAT
ncbi:MAG: efflux RND transporter permease subunit [Gammaproteobacteria bacterium]|jgi:multidrug efflux pump subunit AcrB|nr:efflux RND transporter permease subunit [Gammaproteobacteria bacterium]